MTTDIKPGTIVEVTESGYAVVVEPGPDQLPPNSHDAFIWVRYDNGCIVPKREYYVRPLTTDQVIARLNAR